LDKGVADHPIFGQRADWLIWGGRTTLMFFGGGPAIPKRPKINIYKKKKFGFWGWLDHPKGLGVVLTTPYGRYGGGPATPKAFGGDFGHPKLAIGVVRSPQIGQGDKWGG
jgi:hypothetical protein